MTVCPACSKENQPHYRFCLGCGGELPRAPGREPEREREPPPFRIQPVPDRCAYCGLKVPANAVKCPNCSAPQ